MSVMNLSVISNRKPIFFCKPHLKFNGHKITLLNCYKHFKIYTFNFSPYLVNKHFVDWPGSMGAL